MSRRPVPRAGFVVWLAGLALMLCAMTAAIAGNATPGEVAGVVVGVYAFGAGRFLCSLSARDGGSLDR